MIWALVKPFLMSNWKMIAMGFLALCAFLYFEYAQHEIKTLRENNAKLTVAVQMEKAVVTSLQKDFQAATDILKDLAKSAAGYSQDLADLQKKFTKGGRTLAALAVAKPGLVEKAINDATAKEIECDQALTEGKSCAK